MTAEERYLLERVERRAEQVRKLAAMALDREHTFVPTIFAFVAWNLIRTLMLLCPKALLDTFTHWMHGRLREDNGCCDLCGTPKEQLTDVACTDCLKQMQAEEAEALLAELSDDATPH
jgi:hypothetical protein